MSYFKSQNKSQTMVVRCADDRYSQSRQLTEAFRQILENEGATDHFEISVFGSSLDVIQDPAGWKKRLKTAVSFGITKVILVDHLDCADYAKAYGELSKEEEAKKHGENLSLARKILREAGLNFSAYLQEFDHFQKLFESSSS